MVILSLCRTWILFPVSGVVPSSVRIISNLAVSRSSGDTAHSGDRSSILRVGSVGGDSGECGPLSPVGEHDGPVHLEEVLRAVEVCPEADGEEVVRDDLALLRPRRAHHVGGDVGLWAEDG